MAVWRKDALGPSDSLKALQNGDEEIKREPGLRRTYQYQWGRMEKGVNLKKRSTQRLTSQE